jgi:hypothetical protein
MASWRPVAASELLVPGQSLIAIFDGDAATRARLAAAVRELPGLSVQGEIEGGRSRTGALYRVIAPTRARDLVSVITTIGRGTSGTFALLTVDVEAVIEESLDEAIENVGEIAFAPWNAALRLVPRARLPVGLIVGGILGVLTVGGIAVYALTRK